MKCKIYLYIIVSFTLIKSMVTILIRFIYCFILLFLYFIFYINLLLLFMLKMVQKRFIFSVFDCLMCFFRLKIINNKTTQYLRLLRVIKFICIFFIFCF